MEWYRRYHGTCQDAKIHKASRRAGVPRYLAIAAWDAVLECASAASNRGDVNDVDAEMIAIMIGCEDDEAQRVLEAFKELFMIEEDHVKAWAKRQSSDPGAAERMARYRAKRNAPVTDRNGNVANSDPENGVENRAIGPISDQNGALEEKLDNADIQGKSDTCQNVTERNAVTQIDREDREESISSKSSTSKRSKPRSDQSASGSDDPEEFVSFWLAYPRKEGKGQARRAWRAATKRAGPERIMRGLAASVIRWRNESTEPRFIPLPATWLNGERWSDQPPEQQVKRPPEAWSTL